MSGKDYAGWQVEKQRLNSLTSVQYCYEKEVWWMSLGCNIGFEEDGKGDYFGRPVLIIRKFNYRFILGVPLSNSDRIGRYYYHLAPGEHKTALLSQVRPLDTRRLLNPFGRVSDEDFQAIRAKLKDLL